MNKQSFTAFVAALLFVGTAAPQARAADSGSALLAKYSAFMGWKLGDGSLTAVNYTLKSTADKSGKVVVLGQVRRIGVVFRTKITEVRAHVTDFEGFTGQVAWSSDGNGFTVPLVGPYAKYLVASDLLFANALTSAPASLRGRHVIGGVNCRSVRVAPPGVDPVDLCINEQTGRLLGATIDPGGSYETTLDILGFAMALPGKQIIARWKYDGAAHTYAISDIEANHPATSAQLEPPPQSAHWTFANTKPFPIKLTQYRIILHASINGVPGKFILDSGADGIYLSRDFANRAKIKLVGSGKANGVTGDFKIRSGHVASIAIGGNTLSNVTVTVMGGSQTLDKKAPDGAMGFDLLAGTFATIDFKNATLQLQDPNTADPTTIKGVHLAVDLSTGQPVVRMLLDHKIAINATLDSGNPINVLVSNDLVYKHGLVMLVDNSMQGYLNSHLGIGGANGQFEIGRCGHVDSIRLGPADYTNAPTCLTSSFTGRDALVGLDFLRGFSSISFDYSRGGMIFVPPTP